MASTAHGGAQAIAINSSKPRGLSHLPRHGTPRFSKGMASLCTEIVGASSPPSSQAASSLALHSHGGGSKDPYSSSLKQLAARKDPPIHTSSFPAK